jgi:hypothetical protein
MSTSIYHNRYNMDIDTALAHALTVDKELKRKISILVKSHGFTDHTKDITDFIHAFLQDVTKFASKEMMPQEWKSNSAFAKAFEALASFMDIENVKRHLVASMGTTQVDLAKNKCIELKRKYDRLAQEDTKQKKQNKQTVDTQVAQAPTPPPEEKGSPPESKAESDSDSIGSDTESLESTESCERLISFSPTEMTQFFRAYERAMEYIRKSAFSEQDPSKRILMQQLYHSIRDIEPRCKRTSS